MVPSTLDATVTLPSGMLFGCSARYEYGYGYGYWKAFLFSSALPLFLPSSPRKRRSIQLLVLVLSSGEINLQRRDKIQREEDTNFEREER